MARSLQQVHDQFVTPQADATSFNHLTSREASDAKAFQNFTAVQADATSFNNLQRSGYKIILTPPPTFTFSCTVTENNTLSLARRLSRSFAVTEAMTAVLSRLIQKVAFTVVETETVSASIVNVFIVAFSVVESSTYSLGNWLVGKSISIGESTTISFKRFLQVIKSVAETTSSTLSKLVARPAFVVSGSSTPTSRVGYIYFVNSSLPESTSVTFARTLGIVRLAMSFCFIVVVRALVKISAAVITETASITSTLIGSMVTFLVACSTIPSLVKSPQLSRFISESSTYSISRFLSSTLPGLVVESTSVNLSLAKYVLNLAVACSTTASAIQKLRQHFFLQLSTCIARATQVYMQLSTAVQAVVYAPNPVNLPPDDPDNPLQASVTVGGNVISSFESTSKGAVDQISFNESVLAPNCDLVKANVSLSTAGNSFSIETKSKSFSVGQHLTILGMPWIVTKVTHVQGSKNNWITTGIYGNSLAMDMKLLLVLTLPQLSALGPLAPTAPLQSPPSVQWSTISAAAQAIASAAGVGLSWSTVDAPLLDTFIETDMRVEDALHSLAGRVKGIMVPDGFGGYVVTDPVTGHGGWSGIPDCNLYAKDNSLVTSDNLNIDENFVTLPIKPVISSSITTMPSAPPPPIIEPIWSTTQVLNPNSPAVPIPLPGDANGQISGNSFFPPSTSQPLFDPNNPDGSDFNCFIRVLFRPSGPSIVNGMYVPGPGLNVNLNPAVLSLPYATTDPTKWFPVALPMQWDQIQQKMMLQLDPSFFPNNQSPAPPATLTNGQFTLEIGYQKRVQPIKDAYTVNLAEKIQQANLFQQYQLARIQYFKYRDCQFSSSFFGSVPLPGNKTSLTYGGDDGDTFNGIIESVNISWAGGSSSLPVMTGTGGTYTSLDLITPAALLNYFLATGTTPP